ncbi:MAG: sulfatase [Myxococcales bacterium]|nr:sulfatase [Myxococcales bacterium]
MLIARIAALARGLALGTRLLLPLALIDLATLMLAAGPLPVWERALAAVSAGALGAPLLLGGAALLSLLWPARAGRPGWSAGLRAWLTGGDATLQAGRSGLLLSLLVCTALFAVAGFVCLRPLIAGTARAHFAAMGAVGVLLVLLAIAAALVPLLARRLALLVVVLRRVPGLGALLRDSGRLALALGLGGLLAGALALVLGWEVFRHLPWGWLGPVSGALAVAVVWSFFVDARDRELPAPRVFAIVGLALVTAGVIGAVSTTRAAGLHARRSVLGHAGYRTASALLDFDRDGHLGSFGGGDCRPRDARVYPGALEVPRNGVDEDCNGSDLDAEALLFDGRYDHPLPVPVDRRPPLYLITVDAFAARRMRLPETMPKLSAWLSGARDFTAAFSQGPSTRLSFPSIFTSRLDSEVERVVRGKAPFRLGDKQPMLAALVKKAGYQTHAIVPVQYFTRKRWRGLTRGFDSVTYAREGRPKKAHTSGQVTDAALERMERFGERPPFLWVHYFDAHAPHRQPEGITETGTSDTHRYDAELRFIDEHLARLLEAIEQRHGGEAVVVLTGDHGWAADPPRHRKKHYGYDLHSATLHVPLAVRAPFVKPGSQGGLASTLDILPTIANLLGLRPGMRFRGTSLVPELLGATPARPQWLVHEFYLPERKLKRRDPLDTISLRTPRFNLIFQRGPGTIELYDWQADYFERRDLAQQPEHAQTRAALEGQLKTLLYGLQPRDRAQ